MKEETPGGIFCLNRLKSGLNNLIIVGTSYLEIPSIKEPILLIKQPDMLQYFSTE